MARFFIPRQWRLPRCVWFLIVFELPFTVANLALFGIASPNLYRTILWNEGGRMGFNSRPSTVVYAYANYRPVTIPLVWSNFNTQYHLVIGVVCMFFYLIKTTMWLLNVFLPIFSVLLHIPLLAIWAYGIYLQTSPDTIDPAHINNGAPWYITKSCNIVADAQIRSYCVQAKSAFAVSVIMLAIYVTFLALSIYSFFPTHDQRQHHAARRAEKKADKEKWAASPTAADNPMTPEEQWQHMWELQQLPRTPGTAGFHVPMTPRTTAFADLEGGGGGGGGGGGYAPQHREKGWGVPGWHAGAGNGNGAGHAVSPVQEQDEYAYAYAQGQRSSGTAH